MLITLPQLLQVLPSAVKQAGVNVAMQHYQIVGVLLVTAFWPRVLPVALRARDLGGQVQAGYEGLKDLDCTVKGGGSKGRG